jgi:hypothetical protein
LTASREFKTFFFDDIEADEPEVAHVFLDEIGDVVISNEEQVEWHVLAVAEKLVFGAGEL